MTRFCLCGLLVFGSAMMARAGELDREGAKAPTPNAKSSFTAGVKAGAVVAAPAVAGSTELDKETPQAAYHGRGGWGHGYHGGYRGFYGGYGRGYYGGWGRGYYGGYGRGYYGGYGRGYYGGWGWPSFSIGFGYPYYGYGGYGYGYPYYGGYYW